MTCWCVSDALELHKISAHGETTTKSLNSAASKKLWGDLAGDGNQRVYEWRTSNQGTWYQVYTSWNSFSMNIRSESNIILTLEIWYHQGWHSQLLPGDHSAGSNRWGWTRYLCLGIYPRLGVGSGQLNSSMKRQIYGQWRLQDFQQRSRMMPGPHYSSGEEGISQYCEGMNVVSRTNWEKRTTGVVEWAL